MLLRKSSKSAQASNYSHAIDYNHRHLWRWFCIATPLNKWYCIAMEDLPYLSEDHNTKYRLESLEHNVTKLEDYLRCGIYDQDYCDELLDAVRADIGDEGQDKQSSLRAFGFALDHNDVLIPTMAVIDAAVAYRHDVEIRQVYDTERVLIHYEVHDDNDQVAAFYVPPLAVLSNAREQETPTTLRTGHYALGLIDDNASSARQKIFVSEFYQSDIDKQNEVLQDIAKDLHDNLEVEYGADVPVSVGVCGYYRAPADVDIRTINWKDNYHQAPGIKDDQIYTLDGVIFNVVYLEALNGLRERVSGTNDLDLGYGLPCIILIDQAKGEVYYVPVVDIVSFYSESDNI